MPTLAQAVAAQDNDHTAITESYTARTGLDWHAPTPADHDPPTAISVVIPAHNNAYSLPPVLGALANQHTRARLQVVVIDDASSDGTTDLIARHPRVDTAVRLRRQVGAAAARNVGVHLATEATILFVDADMVLASHVLADVAARARDDTVLVGFRHNIAYQPGPDDQAVVPPGEPDLDADHRAQWAPPAGVPMFYSGQVYPTPFVCRPLDDTHDFIELGHGRSYFDWDLPRMFVTALVAAPRAAILDVGGFDPAFGPRGWGSEDTHLGAALIAAGCSTIPLRQARGWHIDPPDADTVWQAKYSGAAARIAQYRTLLDGPPPTGRSADFTRRAEALIRKAETLS